MGLIQKRKKGQSIIIEDPNTGKFVEVIVAKINTPPIGPSHVQLVFEDPDHSFNIIRTETLY